MNKKYSLLIVVILVSSCDSTSSSLSTSTTTSEVLTYPHTSYYSLEKINEFTEFKTMLNSVTRVSASDGPYINYSSSEVINNITSYSYSSTDTTWYTNTKVDIIIPTSFIDPELTYTDKNGISYDRSPYYKRIKNFYAERKNDSIISQTILISTFLEHTSTSIPFINYSGFEYESYSKKSPIINEITNYKTNDKYSQTTYNSFTMYYMFNGIFNSKDKQDEAYSLHCYFEDDNYVYRLSLYYYNETYVQYYLGDI